MSTELPPSGAPGSDEDMHPMAKVLFGWVSAAITPRLIFWGMAALSAALLLADFVVHRHVKAEIEGYYGFYGFYGFIAFAFVVLMGWPLGRLLRRGENYYGDADDGENRS